MERRSGGGIHGGSRVRQKGGESEWEGCRKERRITCVFLESCKESRKKKLQDIHPSKAKTIKCSLIARWNIKRTYSIVRSKRM